MDANRVLNSIKSKHSLFILALTFVTQTQATTNNCDESILTTGTLTLEDPLVPKSFYQDDTFLGLTPVEYYDGMGVLELNIKPIVDCVGFKGIRDPYLNAGGGWQQICITPAEFLDC